MRKALFGALVTIVCTGGFACAQTAPSDATVAPPATGAAGDGGAGIRSGHITSTGATVPNPGVSQSGGTTSLDRGVQQQDNKIDSSICKGC